MIMWHLRIETDEEWRVVAQALASTAAHPGAAPYVAQVATRVRERLVATPDVPALDLDEAMLLAPPLHRCEARVPDLSGASHSGTRTCGVRLVAPGGRCPAVEYHAGT